MLGIGGLPHYTRKNVTEKRNIYSYYVTVECNISFIKYQHLFVFIRIVNFSRKIYKV